MGEWGNPESDYVVVRDPMVIAAFIQLFDRAFDRRPARGAATRTQEDEDQRLLKLLGLGLKDESIARYLGCSLRTVRRRVARPDGPARRADPLPARAGRVRR